MSSVTSEVFERFQVAWESFTGENVASLLERRNCIMRAIDSRVHNGDFDSPLGSLFFQHRMHSPE